jgi:YD repeat-containing protein
MFSLTPRVRAPHATGRLVIALLCALSFLAGPARPVSAVDTRDGSYVYSHLDVRIADDTDFKFSRTYSSLEARPGPLGPGWTHSFNVRLLHESVDGQEALTFVGPTARAARFAVRPGGRFPPISGNGGTLIQYQDGPFAGSYELAAPGGTHYEFAPDGRATQIIYPNKTTVALTYDDAGRLQSVADRGGTRQLTFGYRDDSDHLVSVKDWLDPPREIRFGYDELDRLASMTDRLDAVTRYAYDGESARLTQIIDRLGRPYRTVEYNPDGTVSKEWSARDLHTGWPTTVAYESLEDGAPRTTVSYSPAAYAPDTPVTVVDTYDGDRRLARREFRPAPGEDPIIQESTYDAKTAKTTNAVFGGRNEIVEPGAHCVMEAELPGSPWPVEVGEELRRTPIARPTAETMPPDRQDPDEWDVDDERIDAAGRVVSMRLDQIDGLWSETWRYTYDAEDRITAIRVSPLDGRPEQTMHFEYNPVGDVVAMTAPDGGVTHYEYNELSALILVQKPGGESIRYAYDVGGLHTQTTVLDAGGATVSVVDYVHDGLGRLRRVVDHQGTDDAPGPITTELSYRQYVLTGICQH